MYRFALRVPRHERAALGRLLSADERQRAARFHFAGDRDRFVVARGRLRLVLACAGAGAPDRIRFAYGRHGKPSLALQPELQFNLSHTVDVAVVAVTENAAVGVDIEGLQRGRRLAQAAHHFFSAAERTALLQLADDIRAEAALRCWCRKEAFLKARGEGLARPLDSFDVAVADLARRRDGSLLLATRPDSRESAHWDVRDIDVGAGYAAAVAVRGRIGRVDLGSERPRRSSCGRDQDSTASIGRVLTPADV